MLDRCNFGVRARGSRPDQLSSWGQKLGGRKQLPVAGQPFQKINIDTGTWLQISVNLLNLPNLKVQAATFN